jgi:hypothetical protein
VEFVAYFALPAAPFRVACVAEFWPPQLLKGKKGGRIWAKVRLKDRIDAIIAHEYEKLRRRG